ncbi:AlpA family transcriptional regulator [Vibrio sp. 99-8-1]|nr:AlpA family transcriptional regulator [Vibrio sp. 99-8-1]
MGKTIKLSEILELTKVSKVTVYRWIKNGNFPRPINFGGRSSVWLESEVNDWLDQKIKQRHH